MLSPSVTFNSSLTTVLNEVKSEIQCQIHHMYLGGFVLQ